MNYKTCYKTPIYNLSNFASNKELNEHLESCLMNLLIQLQSNMRTIENVEITITDTTASAKINMSITFIN